MTDQQLRISDAERERASADLAEHYAQGRLTTEEHAERLDRIWAARTRAELTPVFIDLPGGGVVRAPRQVRSSGAGRRFRGLPTPLVVVLVILAAVMVLAHLPLILIGLGVWFLLSRRSHCAPHPRRAKWS